MKKFCESLREYAIKITNFKKNIRNICKYMFEDKYIKNIVNLEIVVIIQENIKVLCIVYCISKEITEIFHNGSN